MPKVITVTDMVRSFSDIIGRVHYQGESFDIKKGTKYSGKASTNTKQADAYVGRIK